MSEGLSAWSKTSDSTVKDYHQDSEESPPRGGRRLGGGQEPGGPGGSETGGPETGDTQCGVVCPSDR